MDKISSLKKLKELLEEGIITEEEFQWQKKIILGKSVKDALSSASEAIPEGEEAIISSQEHQPESAPEVIEVDASSTSIIVDEEDEDHYKREVAASLIEPDYPDEQKAEKTEEEEEAERIKTCKERLWAGIIVCLVGIVFGVLYLLNDDIVDRVVKYEKAGFAILQLEKTGPEPHIIVMDKKGLYYDNSSSVTEILPVGKELDTREIHLHYDANNGLKAIAEEAEKSFAMKSSRGYYVMRLADKAYLISTKQIAGNPLTDYNLSLEPCFLIVKKDKSKDVTVIKVPKSKTDGSGNLHWKLSRNILDQYDSYFKSAFSKDDYKKIKERKYGHYLATVELSLKSGKVHIEGLIDFDKLGSSYPANKVGTHAHCSSMRETIHGIFRRELEESFYNNASQLTGVSNRSLMKITDDDRYTFVINPNYHSGNQPKGLLRVNNKTKVVTLIDTGKEIEFYSSSICVTKIETFLIFFDSEKKVFYDYAGNRRN